MARGPRHGWGHRKARAWYLARYVPGVTRCSLGDEVLTVPLVDSHLLDLAHDDANPGRYKGLACRHHNRSAHRQSPFSSRNKTRASTTIDVADERERERRERVEQRERERRRRIITPDEDGGRG